MTLAIVILNNQRAIVSSPAKEALSSFVIQARCFCAPSGSSIRGNPSSDAWALAAGRKYSSSSPEASTSTACGCIYVWTWSSSRRSDVCSQGQSWKRFYLRRARDTPLERRVLVDSVDLSRRASTAGLATRVIVFHSLLQRELYHTVKYDLTGLVDAVDSLQLLHIDISSAHEGKMHVAPQLGPHLTSHWQQLSSALKAGCRKQYVFIRRRRSLCLVYCL